MFILFVATVEEFVAGQLLMGDRRLSGDNGLWLSFWLWTELELWCDCEVNCETLKGWFMSFGFKVPFTILEDRVGGGWLSICVGTDDGLAKLLSSWLLSLSTNDSGVGVGDSPTLPTSLSLFSKPSVYRVHFFLRLWN